MVNRVAKYMKKVLSPPSNVLTGIGSIALVFIMLIVSADVFMRSAFNSPIRGSGDLVILAFSMIAFFGMASAALEGEHVMLNAIVEKLPRVLRHTIQAAMMFITTMALGFTTWRLCMQGLRLQSMDAVTAILRIPTPPFLYLATLAFALMTLVFLMKTFESITRIRGER